MDIFSIIKNRINQSLEMLGKNYYPSIIQIGITNRCNLQCIICSRKFTDRDMSFKEFKYVIDQFSEIKKISIVGQGENFLNKDFFNMLEYAKLKGNFVEFYDNFCLLNDKIIDKLINIKPDIVWASLDGATKETYELIRVGSNFEIVLNNIKSLIELKEIKKINYPKINFNYVVNKYNFKEILKFIELIGSIKKNEEVLISFVNTMSIHIDLRNIYSDDNQQKIILQANQRAKEIGVLLEWRNFPRIKMSIQNCEMWTRPCIMPNGDFFPCCVINGQAPFGNVFQENFKELWNKNNYKNFRKNIAIGKVPLFCKKCEILL